MNNKIYGNFGEAKATEFLKKSGYKILTCNYSKKEGEIDIIALETKKARKKRENYKQLSPLLKKEDVLVFVEVKSRNSTKFGRPSDAVNLTKQKHYEKVASSFRLTNPKFAVFPFRFDIIEVVGEEVENHLINAF